MATEIIGSKMPALNKYGQNGYAGTSSDTDFSNRTQSAMAAEHSIDLNGAFDKAGLEHRVERPGSKAERAARIAARNAFKQPKFAAPQMRTVDATGYKPAFGMEGASVGPKIPAKCGAGEAPLPRDPNAK